MNTTIDAAGRIVIPKTLREAAHLEPGMPLHVRLRDGRIEIEPHAAQVTIEDHDGVAVAIARLPPLTLSLVEDTLQQVRDSRRD